MKSKIFILTISCLALFIVLFSCKKKNTITDNNPPNTPSVPFFTTENNRIGDNITFKVTAIDPDDDSIAARFDWGDGDTSGWSNFVPSGDTMWGTHCYNSINIYNVRAQIKDSKEIVSEWSESIPIGIQDTLFEIVWTCATPSAPWSRRLLLNAVVFNNKIWVLGGLAVKDSHNVAVNDIWYSSDGINWICATESAPWSPRTCQTSFVFDNKIWVLGGITMQVQTMYEVWSSTDGFNWTLINDSAPCVRGWKSNSSVVFHNKMWMIGGGTNDVWSSSDGIKWDSITFEPGWPAREFHTTVNFNNKIWVIGGWNNKNGLNDVWFSTSGESWNCAIDSAAWLFTHGHESVVIDGKMWLLGGKTYYRSGRQTGHPGTNDVWFSSDGAKWTCVTDSAAWQARCYFASVIFDNKIWILGGSGRIGYLNSLNDVWYGEIVHGKR